MKPNTSLPYPKQPEIEPYRELDKSTSRITPDFIMAELSIIIRLRLGPPLDSYLLVFRLKLWVKISIFCMCLRCWSSYVPSFEQIKNIWYRAEVLTSGSRRSGPPFKVSSLYWIRLFSFTDSFWWKVILYVAFMKYAINTTHSFSTNSVKLGKRLYSVLWLYH